MKNLTMVILLAAMASSRTRTDVREIVARKDLDVVCLKPHVERHTHTHQGSKRANRKYRWC